jgi:ankyrin repeat protein
MSSDTPSYAADTNTAGASSSSPSETMTDKQKEKARVSRTSLILWHAHQNDAAAVRKLLEEDPSLVRAMDYDSRTPLHVASLHGWVDVAKCLIEFGADVNAQDRWKNTVCIISCSFGCRFIYLSASF